MANTVIQLKYSSVTSQPATLNIAEPAYSNVSGVLWIDDGTGVVAIGGKAYTTIIDNATASATGNTLALRDATGNAAFNYITANVVGNIDTGNLNSAGVVSAAGNISASGVIVSGSGGNITGANINGNLYGNGAAISSITGANVNIATLQGQVYANANVAFAGGLIPAAYSLIGTIVTNNSSNVTIANNAWSNIANQLVLEHTNQTNAGLVFGNLIAGQRATGLITSLSSYGVDTSEGGASWMLESVANTSTLGGQAIISSLRESRNQVLLQTAGVQTDIVVNGTIPQTPANNLSSGQYTASEAASRKIVGGGLPTTAPKYRGSSYSYAINRLMNTNLTPTGNVSAQSSRSLNPGTFKKT